MKTHRQMLGSSLAGSLALICATVFVASTPSSAPAAGMVGTGTAASCTDAVLNAALAGGGLVTFNCGAAPVTIDISGTKTISADTTLDGGGLIAITGISHENTLTMFSVNSGVNFTMKHLTIAYGGVSCEAA